MPERQSRGDPAPEIERAKQIFRFLKAFAEQNMPVRRTLGEQLWSYRLAELPSHPSISVIEVRGEGDSVDGQSDASAEPEPLIRVRRPRLTSPPRPPAELVEWLTPGWQSVTGPVEHVSVRNQKRGIETVTVAFDDDEARPRAFADYKQGWDRWAEAERPAVETMRVFERLYELKGRIDRESERVELMLGDGRLRWLRADGGVDHPVLLQRVDLQFDPSVPEFRVVDADRPPELYGAVLQGSDGMSAREMNQLRVQMESGSYHPLAGSETDGFLRRLAQQLGPRGRFDRDGASQRATSDPLVARDPVLFLRARVSGFPAAFDRVLEDLERPDASVPTSLTRLVGITPAEAPERPRAEDSPWGEPPDVLLSKPANPEQVAIARALDHHRAVLVQGPPGTGKSHTIANLIGHLVAQGKKVLVTSHTTKALRVLRDQVVDTLRPLCVAVLDSDTEARAQMEQAVRGIISRITTARESALERELAELAEARAELNGRIGALTGDLRAVRESEYRSIVVAGESVPPAEAARWVREHEDGNDWIPGPVEAGAPLPLRSAEVADLSATNDGLTLEEEREIEAALPPLAEVPPPEHFSALLARAAVTEPAELAVFWSRAPSPEEAPRVDALRDLAEQVVEYLRRVAPWQRALIAAGYAGAPESELWTELESKVRESIRLWEAGRREALDHDPTIVPPVAPEEALAVATEILTHLGQGGSLGWVTLATHARWRAALGCMRVNGVRPTEPEHFRAIAAIAAMESARLRLAKRWTRQAEPAGFPEWSALGPDPERLLGEYADQFAPLLGWWGEKWAAISDAASQAGFDWEAFRRREVARSGPELPFERDARILGGSLEEVAAARVGACRAEEARRVLASLVERLARYHANVCRDLAQAVSAASQGAYEAAYARLRHLAGKRSVWELRMALLDRLAPAARTWAEAIRRRSGVHGAGTVLGDVDAAWRWRQLRQEIDRRAALDETALTRQLEQSRQELRRTTAELIDRRSWLGQLRRTGLEARQALQGWVDVQRRIGKGTGKRAPALQVEARRLLTRARDAVPVWIMPLARVAESFDPRTTRFDVVIVDEASQSDPTGLLAWYLGERIAVVGDHQQVSPLGVGQKLEGIEALIAEHLIGIPNAILYDGTLSIYDLARQSFGGTIALREHFRCVPDIIEFSNWLSYDGEIRPLRNPATAPEPHVIEYCVEAEGATGRSGKTNLSEARVIAALVKAMCGMPEYAGKTIGAVTLMGDEQADAIQDLTVRLVGAVELERVKFAAGNSAQFQGDERDVMLLSMVDAPPEGPLPMRTQDLYKQRYNVAASRAKDQLWLVHSLEPGRDLKPGDLRRRLIEYVRDPGAQRRALEAAEGRAESPFELAVIERLLAAGYRVEPQVWVGRYRMDMVVRSPGKEVAIECDGDRYHGVDQIPDDMLRQAILERAGWRFVRIRGTRFFRDPAGTMEWVFGELAQLGVVPGGMAEEALAADPTDGLRARVVRRAHEIMREMEWLPPETPVGLELDEN